MVHFGAGKSASGFSIPKVNRAVKKKAYLIKTEAFHR
jgi:hypothetical protein